MDTDLKGIVIRTSVYVRSYALLLIVFLLFSGAAFAQPQLNFKRIVNNWPWIELYFTVTCNGQQASFVDKRVFNVRENVLNVGDFELWCPDLTMDCTISTALVFDASARMSGSKRTGAIAAGNAFLDFMARDDEATLVWFSSAVTIAQGMTSYSDLLHNAMNSIPASGTSLLWDGIYFGLLEVVNNGVNPCRSVIVLTDGIDNSSSHTPEEIVALANRNRIRVVAVSLDTNVNMDQLRNIVDQTGGRWYETQDPSRLKGIYEELFPFLLYGIYDCVITYRTECMDGGNRTVDLSLVNFCNGQDTKTKTYKAPKDTSTFQPLRFGIAKRDARANTDVTVPLELRDSFSNEMLNASTFAVQFDTSLLDFNSITIPPGSALEGVPISVNEHGDTIIIRTLDKKLVDVHTASATLFEMSFTAADSDRKDTVCTPLRLLRWFFEAGCFRPVLADGEVCILPKQPTGVSENSPPQPRLDLYPQPAGDRLIVSARDLRGGAHRLIVSDLVGRVVFLREYRAQGAIDATIDISQLPSGIYVLRLFSEDGMMGRVAVKR